MTNLQNPNPSNPQQGTNLQDIFSNWQQQYAQGNTQNIPHDQVCNAYNQWCGQAAPQQAHQAAEQAFAQLAPQQRGNVANTLVNILTQHGITPQAAGVQTTNPSQMSPADLAQLTNYAQQQNPDLIRQLLSNPIVGMVISAALSYALQRFVGGAASGTGGFSLPGLFGGGTAQPGTTYTQPQQPPAGNQGGGLGGLITEFLGGGNKTNQ
jgi:hypothetical protein